MRKVFKDKDCTVCGCTYTPTSPKQKYCTICKSKAVKINQANRDKNRYKKKQKNKILFSKECLSCGITFNTYYTSKKYCGDAECEKFRVKLKNINSHVRRDKKELIDKGRRYYKNNREKCLISKARQYREVNTNAKEYV